jgi:hypothetical protein
VELQGKVELKHAVVLENSSKNIYGQYSSCKFLRKLPHQRLLPVTNSVRTVSLPVLKEILISLAEYCAR